VEGNGREIQWYLYNCNQKSQLLSVCLTEKAEQVGKCLFRQWRERNFGIDTQGNYRFFQTIFLYEKSLLIKSQKETRIEYSM